MQVQAEQVKTLFSHTLVTKYITASQLLPLTYLHSTIQFHN